MGRLFESPIFVLALGVIAVLSIFLIAIRYLDEPPIVIGLFLLVFVYAIVDYLRSTEPSWRNFLLALRDIFGALFIVVSLDYFCKNVLGMNRIDSKITFLVLITFFFSTLIWIRIFLKKFKRRFLAGGIFFFWISLFCGLSVFLLKMHILSPGPTGLVAYNELISIIFGGGAILVSLICMGFIEGGIDW